MSLVGQTIVCCGLPVGPAASQAKWTIDSARLLQDPRPTASLGTNPRGKGRTPPFRPRGAKTRRCTADTGRVRSTLPTFGSKLPRTGLPARVSRHIRESGVSRQVDNVSAQPTAT